jgi:hypothetical protein
MGGAARHPALAFHGKYRIDDASVVSQRKLVIFMAV